MKIITAILITTITLLVIGCSGGMDKVEKEAMLKMMEACPEGATLSTTMEISALFGNEIKLSCTWKKGTENGNILGK